MKTPHPYSNYYKMIRNCLVIAQKPGKEILEERYFQTLAGILFLEFNYPTAFKQSGKELLPDLLNAYKKYSIFGSNCELYRNIYGPESRVMMIAETYDSIEECRIFLSKLEGYGIYEIVELRGDSLHFIYPTSLKSEKNNATKRNF